MVKEKVMMVKFKLSKIYAEENLGVTKDNGNSYHVALVRVREMETFRMGVKILRTQKFDIHWDQRLDLR